MTAASTSGTQPRPSRPSTHSARAEVELQLGRVGPTTLKPVEISALVDRLEELMADVDVVGDGRELKPRWNGRDFYVTIGDRSWEDAQRYGFVSAGGGQFWSKQLEQLFVGARVFLYKPQPVKGYVGVGVVRESTKPVTEFEVDIDGQKRPILEAPLAEPEKLAHDADDPELREHVVRVEWLEARPLADAVWQTGLFTNQMPACKLRDRETIEYLERGFGLAREPGFGPQRALMIAPSREGGQLKNGPTTTDELAS